MSVELEGDKHEKLWFTDGNIILCVTTTTATTSNSVGERGCNVDTSTDEHGTQATEVDSDRGKKRRRTEEGSIDVSENTSSVKRILFRVHKSILSKHSPVFEGMFTLLDSSNHSERTDSDLELSYSTPDHRKSVNSVYEGVPIVELSDSKEQVEQLLGFFYDLLCVFSSLVFILNSSEFLFFSPPSLKFRDSNTPIRLLPLMEMARKYEVEAISKYIVERVEADWPKTLEKWDKADEVSKVLKGQDAAAAWRKTKLPEPIVAINFAKRFGLYGILPAAFLELLRTPYESRWDKTYSQDKRAEAGKSRTKSARWHLLSNEDHMLLGRLRELIRQQPEKCLQFKDDCTDLGHDGVALSECQEYLQLKICATDDALRVSQACCDAKLSDWRTRYSLCDSCCHTIYSALGDLRTQIWIVVKENSE